MLELKYGMIQDNHERTMLRDLTVQNYRTFKNLEVDNLARVNLIVGNNNSGKTSFLEAIWILINQGRPQALFERLDDRDENFSFVELDGRFMRRRVYQVKHIFYEHQLREDQSIKIFSSKEQEYSIGISLQLEPNQPSSAKQGLLYLQTFIDEIPEELSDDLNVESNLSVTFDYGNKVVFKFPVSPTGRLDTTAARNLGRPSFRRSDELASNMFLSTSNLSFSRLATLWDKINLRPDENKVLEALKILEPRVERINFTSGQASNSVILKMEHQLEPVPLGSMGDGMRRILTLAIAAGLFRVRGV
ncbi:ATP/GTP-binding protein [Candidatus Cyanaurora vandensis]|uniref:AAA family ATPase n=1 Tax=Candidatus Cyanaurora vandensis TaxID=2714958 RepID=UPI0025806195|nr:AAA family ATPase [Candidatus Cyanaurora vandensis]